MFCALSLLIYWRFNIWSLKASLVFLGLIESVERLEDNVGGFKRVTQSEDVLFEEGVLGRETGDHQAVTLSNQTLLQNLRKLRFSERHVLRAVFVDLLCLACKRRYNFAQSHQAFVYVNRLVRRFLRVARTHNRNSLRTSQVNELHF